MWVGWKWRCGWRVCSLLYEYVYPSLYSNASLEAFMEWRKSSFPSYVRMIRLCSS